MIIAYRRFGNAKFYAIPYIILKEKKIQTQSEHTLSKFYAIFIYNRTKYSRFHT